MNVRGIADILKIQPDFFETLCIHIASGGSLLDIAEMNKIPFGVLSKWIHEDNNRRERYAASMVDQAEACKAMYLRELKRIALFQITDILDETGRVKPLSEWPKEAGAVIKEIKVDELFDGYGKERTQIGETKLIKFWDKTKAMDSLMKNLGMLQPDVQVQLTMGDLLEEVNKRDDRPE